MTPEEREYEEWLDSFTSPPLTVMQIDQFRSRASETGDRELRFLAEEARFLRYMLKVSLECFDDLAAARSDSERTEVVDGSGIKLVRLTVERYKL